MTTLRQDYQILINKHFAAVQTDTELGHTDNFFKVEKLSKKFWDEFKELETAFIARLEER
jgi:hypothetical protein